MGRRKPAGRSRASSAAGPRQAKPGDEENARLRRALAREKERRRGLEKDLAASHRELTDSLEQQTAAADILRIISTSPTDFRPVLDEVARSAARFCGATDVSILQIDGRHLRVTAHHGSLSRGTYETQLVPIERGTLNGRALLERRTINVVDLQAEDAEFPTGSALARAQGHRSVV